MASDGRSDPVSDREAAAAAFRQYLAREAEGVHDHEGLFRALSPGARGLAEQMLSDLAMLRSRHVERGPEPGLRLGSYELVRLVGTGGASSVWVATDLRLEREVAVKILHPALALSEAQIDRFQRESRLSAAIAHPGICQVHDVGFDRGFHFIVQELVPEGRTLATRIDELRRSPEPGDDWRTVAELFLHICEAVAAVHRSGITHRDLKPNNLLLRPDGRPLVADFGLAAVLEESSLGRTSLRMGTPYYLAPEQVAGEQLHGFSGDVFSLGVSLYETLLLRRPFDGETATIVGRKILEDEPVPPRRLKPTIPRDLETIVLHALEKDPERRYPDAGAMADDLRRLLDHRPILAARAGRGRRLVQLARRYPARAATLASCVLLLVLAVGFLVETSRLSAELRARSESLEVLLAGVLDMATYLAPGNPGDRSDDVLDSLPELEREARASYGDEPFELASWLGAIAIFWGELGAVENEIRLLYEAIRLMDESSDPRAASFELRIRLFDVLYRELRSEDAFEVATEGLERLGDSGDVTDRKRLHLRAEAVAHQLGDRERLDTPKTTSGTVETSSTPDNGEAELDERTKLDLEYWRLVSRTNGGDYSGAVDEAGAILERYRNVHGAGDPRSLDAGVAVLRIWKESSLRGEPDADDWQARAAVLSRDLLEAVSRGFRAGTSLGIRIRRVRAEILLYEGRASEAVDLYDEILEDLADRLPPDAPRLLEVRVGRACALLSLDPARSVRELDEVLQAHERAPLTQEQLNLTARKALCMALINAGEFERALEAVEACCKLHSEHGGEVGVAGVVELLQFLALGSPGESVVRDPRDSRALRARPELVRRWLAWSLEQGTGNQLEVPEGGIAIVLWLAEQAHASENHAQRDEWLSFANQVMELDASDGARDAHLRYILRTGDPSGQARQQLARLDAGPPIEELMRSLRARQLIPALVTKEVITAATFALLTEGGGAAGRVLGSHELEPGEGLDAECCEVWAVFQACAGCPTALAAHLLQRLPDPEVGPSTRRMLERVCEAHAGPCAAPPESVQRLDLEPPARDEGR